ncbi:MAG: TrkA C-terminal domain-containing protein [Planctomycetes bacterium]|nr:TrkA C-terminal domain-containing protein [Planctomycetota bacterium]
MIAVFSFILVILLSTLVVRGGAVALRLTGLSWDVASFQAQSAFTGAGFTTSESENIVGHPARRRVISTMITLGSIGVSSALATVVVTFSTAGDDIQIRTWWMIGSLLGLAALIKTNALDKLFIPILTRYLMRSSKLRILDYEELLRIEKGFSVAQLTVEPDTWLTGGPLKELALNEEGILVLNVRRRSGSVLAAPRPKTRLEPGDKVLCYGLEEELGDLAKRPAGPVGERAHDVGARRNLSRLTQERVEETLREPTLFDDLELQPQAPPPDPVNEALKNLHHESVSERDETK